jgi:hypothetical protein
VAAAAAAAFRQSSSPLSKARWRSLLVSNGSFVCEADLKPAACSNNEDSAPTAASSAASSATPGSRRSVNGTLFPLEIPSEPSPAAAAVLDPSNSPDRTTPVLPFELGSQETNQRNGGEGPFSSLCLPLLTEGSGHHASEPDNREGQCQEGNHPAAAAPALPPPSQQNEQSGVGLLPLKMAFKQATTAGAAGATTGAGSSAGQPTTLSTRAKHKQKPQRLWK